MLTLSVLVRPFFPCNLAIFLLIDAPNRFFTPQLGQVEEMEDIDSCTTEVVLNADLSVTVLETNGPKFLKASGSWKKEEDGTFELEIQRVYEAGVESKFASDMGPFTYATLRKFRGRMSQIGSKIGVEGAVLDGLNDEMKVGFFEMIDTTVGEEGEESLKMFNRKSSSS